MLAERYIHCQDQGITPQQLERQTPYMSGQDLV